MRRRRPVVWQVGGLSLSLCVMRSTFWGAKPYEFFDHTGWTTSGTTTRMGDESVLAARAAICVAQFMKQPNPQEQLQAFEKVDTYRRSTFIEKGGWDKMPGEEQASPTVARACANGLEVLMKK